MNRWILLIATAFFLTACASGTPSAKYRNDYSNEVYGRMSFGYTLGK